VIDQFDKLMKAGGKGFSTFLMVYSLAEGYLDGDDFKKTIQEDVDQKCMA
jgi:hypothetical protein